MRKFRKNSGTTDAGAVVSYKNEKKVIVKKVTKHDYSTYENSLEKRISENEAVQSIINSL